MKTISSSRVISRTRAGIPAWEMPVRYGASYACTLIAVAAAQLIIPTPFALLLAGVTALGLPLSLYFRAALDRPDTRFQRAMFNRGIVLVFFIASAIFLRINMPGSFYSPSSFMMIAENGRTIPLLMQVFLIFAVCRCLAIIHDKDAVLSTVPSFSVLLLLIVIHKGPEVVTYFLLWTIMTAVLFALDHRSESRRHVTGYVPPTLAGQDAALSARSLVSVLGLSLFFASILSYFLVSREPNQRGRAESQLIEWVSRLTQLSNFSPDESGGDGPERQIDYTSGPALPTRIPLWQVQVVSPDFRQSYEPQYWRMFTLTRYNGNSWSQESDSGQYVNFRPLTWRSWPMFSPGLRSPVPPHKVVSRSKLEERAKRQKGYDIGAYGPRGEKAMSFFGTSPDTIPVREFIRALETNSGFLPVLPAVRALRLPTAPENIRARRDGAVDVGVMEKEIRRPAMVVSELPPLQEYGARTNGVPTRLSQKPNPGLHLSDYERRLYLQLPKIPQRVGDFAAAALKRAPAEDNAYRRAQRLADAIQKVAVYTLRPPVTPENVDATDYFLFEGRRGYCTYFAGALTVLCRTQGIPARIVSGFTNTEWERDQQGSSGIIREANAHAWTEVFVDGWGWATVDATPADDRGDNAPSMWYDAQSNIAAFLSHIWDWVRGNTVAVLMMLMIAPLFFALASLWFSHKGGASISALIRGRLRSLGNGRPDAEDDAARASILDIYEKTARLMAKHFRRRASWETPNEWLGAAETVVMPHNAAPLQTLARLYTRASYSTKPMSGADAEAAREAAAAIVWRQPKEEKAKR